MAKALRLYSGHDTHGRPIEVAEREDGVWFLRDYGWNGYGRTWSKWESLECTPVFPARVRRMVDCDGAPEYVDIPETERENCIEFGFNVLRIVPGPHRLRLPNP